MDFFIIFELYNLSLFECLCDHKEQSSSFKKDQMEVVTLTSLDLYFNIYSEIKEISPEKSKQSTKNSRCSQ